MELLSAVILFLHLQLDLRLRLRLYDIKCVHLRAIVDRGLLGYDVTWSNMWFYTTLRIVAVYTCYMLVTT
jgi:hypothetical protein